MLPFCGPLQAQKQGQAQQAAEEACHLDATAQRLQAEAHMVASNTQAAAAAASRAQATPHSSQMAAHSMAMMRPSLIPQQQQQQAPLQAACQPVSFAPASMQKRPGGADEGVQQSQQKLESMYLHQAQRLPVSGGQQQQEQGLADMAGQHGGELEDIDEDGTLAWAAADIRVEEESKSAAAAESAGKARLEQRQGASRLPDCPAQHSPQQACAQRQVPMPTPPGYRGVTRHRSFVQEPTNPFGQLERAASFPGAQHAAAKPEYVPPASGLPPAMLQAGQQNRQGSSSLCPPNVAGGAKAPSSAAQASQPMLLFQPAAPGASRDAHLEVGRF